MVAGIVLVALGLKKTIGHVERPLQARAGVRAARRAALYLLAHVAFRWRNVHRFSTQRVITAAILAALIPVAIEIPAIATLSIATAVMTAMIVYELWRFREFRDRLRHGLPIHPEREPSRRRPHQSTPTAGTERPGQPASIRSPSREWRSVASVLRPRAIARSSPARTQSFCARVIAV